MAIGRLKLQPTCNQSNQPTIKVKWIVSNASPRVQDIAIYHSPPMLTYEFVWVFMS